VCAYVEGMYEFLARAVFLSQVTEKKGDGSKKKEPEGGQKKNKKGSDKDGLLENVEEAGLSGYTDAEVIYMYLYICVYM